MIKISLEGLLEAGCHFGHQSRRWHPKMKQYLYDTRDGVHIFDLVKTKEGLEQAVEFLKNLTSQGGEVLFVGTKRQAKAIINEEAERIKVPFVTQRWLGGILTNWLQIERNIKNLIEKKEAKQKGEFKKYTKKEQLLLDREISRLEKFYGGLINLKKLPEAIFIIDIKKEEAAVREARRMNIPVVGIVDSDSDPDWADFVIPCNDDAVGPVKLVVSLIGEAIKEGKALYAKKKPKA